MHDEPIDLLVAVGSLVSKLGLFESALYLTCKVLHPTRTIQAFELGQASGAITTIRAGVMRFPEQDRHSILFHLIEAERVVDLRHALVHGRWTLIEPASGTYVSERAASARDLLKVLGSRRLPKDELEHITKRHEFNAAGVDDACERAHGTALYFLRSLDAWEDYMGVSWDT